jgi:predicted ATP-binding protein involved in virulence
VKIKSLQISNVLSFPYHADVADAAKITFEDGLNIVIGENGSGKSTALEVISVAIRNCSVQSKEFRLGSKRGVGVSKANLHSETGNPGEIPRYQERP